VSQATVSRVINDDPRVAPSTRERVRQVIKRVGYEPNAIARGLVTSRTDLVGVVVSDITNPFYPELLEALGARLAERELKMLLFNAWGQDEQDVVRLLLGQRVDGIIFTSALLDSSVVREVAERGLPVVLANRGVDGIDCDCVRGDNDTGARAAAEHLLALGHRRIGVVVGIGRSSTSRDRLNGFRDALARGGVSLPDELMAYGEFRYDRAYDETLRLLRLADPPTALFCVNDLMAFAALSAAVHEGVHVPERLSVVGFDDIPMASWDAFQLTTVRQPLEEMATEAVDILVERIREPDRAPRTLIFASNLVVRATTGAVTEREGEWPSI